MITPKAINLNIDFENSTPQYCEFMRGDSIQFNFTFNDTYNATKLRVLCYTKRGEYAFGNEFEDLTKAIFYTNYTAGFSGQAVITVQLLDDEENLVNSANVVCKIIESNTQTPFIVSPDFANKTKTELRELILEGKQEIRDATTDAKEEIDGWSDQSTRLANIETDIKTLSQVKSNRGELHFNNGVIATTQNSPLNTSFSYIWTWAVTLEEFDKHTGSYGLFGTTRYWSTSGDNADYGWAIGRKAVSGTLYVGNINFNSTGIVGGGYKGGIHSVLEYLDGNPHIWSVAYNGTNIKLRIDDNVIASYDLKFEKSESKSPFYVGWAVAENVAMFGRVSRIKGFNFDITSEDAPYSLADYIAGKDESPLLNLGGATTYNANANWLAFHGNEGTFDSTNNELTFTGSEATTAGYIVFYVNANIKAGAKVDVSIDSMSTNSSATFTNWQGVAGNTSGLNASGKSANTSYGYSTSFTTTADATNIGFWLWKTGTFTTGETLTLVKPQIKVNGALLSLADYSIQRNSTTKVVLDESGNGNVATITGSVAGTNDTAISAFIDELKTQITQSS